LATLATSLLLTTHLVSTADVSVPDHAGIQARSMFYQANTHLSCSKWIVPNLIVSITATHGCHVIKHSHNHHTWSVNDSSCFQLLLFLFHTGMNQLCMTKTSASNLGTLAVVGLVMELASSLKFRVAVSLGHWILATSLTTKEYSESSSTLQMLFL
jgi:hypothetical protein